MSKEIITFATRTDFFVVSDAIENANGNEYRLPHKITNKIRVAAADNGMNTNAVNGELFGFYTVDESVFTAIKGSVNVLAYWKSSDMKVALKAADPRKALAAITTLVNADAVEPTFVNPYKVGDIVKSDSYYGRIPALKVIKVTDKTYTVAPIVPVNNDAVDNWDTAEANFVNVKVNVKDPYNQMIDFSIPLAGNEDKFKVLETSKRVIRIGKVNKVGIRSGLLDKVAHNNAGYKVYFDMYR